MPMFPARLGEMLRRCTDYNEIDVLEKGASFLREEMSNAEITERVIALHAQIITLVHDEKQVTLESWGRLGVFGLKPNLPFLHQFLEANQGRNRRALQARTIL